MALGLKLAGIRRSLQPPNAHRPPSDARSCGNLDATGDRPAGITISTVNYWSKMQRQGERQRGAWRDLLPGDHTNCHPVATRGHRCPRGPACTTPLAYASGRKRLPDPPKAQASGGPQASPPWS